MKFKNEELLMDLGKSEKNYYKTKAKLNSTKEDFDKMVLSYSKLKEVFDKAFT
jgi:hypothetical protein